MCPSVQQVFLPFLDNTLKFETLADVIDSSDAVERQSVWVKSFVSSDLALRSQMESGGCAALASGVRYFLPQRARYAHQLMPTPETKTASSNGHGVANFPPDVTVFGESEVMHAIRQKIEKVSGADVPVLIQGESGTGKEVIARMIHRRSPRSQGSFIKVNCAAIPGMLLESELFGYEKGSFTGAVGSKPGRVELANGGTLFLDEIAEMDLGLQAKLLQLLQDSQFWRIGGRENISVDVRVICATNRDLEEEIRNGRFRQDLFYRINVVKVQLPGLRERSEDIHALVVYFVEQHSRKYGSQWNTLRSTHSNCSESITGPAISAS